MRPETYSGKSTPIGNSNGFRFEGSLFKVHPEFFGEVRGTVLAPGQMLVSVVSSRQIEDTESDDGNPVLSAFLDSLGKQMAEHPELIEPIDEAQMQRIASLVDGVEVD